LDHDPDNDQTSEIDAEMSVPKRLLYNRIEDFDESDGEGEQSANMNGSSALVAEDASMMRKTLPTTVEQALVLVNEEVEASTHDYCLYGAAPDGWKELCQKLGWREPEATPEIFSEPVSPLSAVLDFRQQLM